MKLARDAPGLGISVNVKLNNLWYLTIIQRVTLWQEPKKTNLSNIPDLCLTFEA